jgi:hypothetical protein
MVGRGHTKEIVGLSNVNSIHLNTLFDGRSWSYQRNREVVKCKLYIFYHPLDLPSKTMFKYIQFTFNNPTVSLV